MHTHTMLIKNIRMCMYMYMAEDIKRNKRGCAGLKRVSLKATFKGRGRRAVMETKRGRIQDLCSIEYIKAVVCATWAS